MDYTSLEFKTRNLIVRKLGKYARDDYNETKQNTRISSISVCQSKI